MKGLKRLLFAGMICAGLSSLGLAQTVTGGLDGRITDSAKAAVPNAQVVAIDPVAGVERTSRTNDAGYFSIAFVPVGTYDVTVTMKGFATLVAKGNEVTLNKTTTLNLVLQVSAVQESEHRRQGGGGPAGFRPRLPLHRDLLSGVPVESDIGAEQLYALERQLRFIQRYGDPRGRVYDGRHRE